MEGNMEVLAMIMLLLLILLAGLLVVLVNSIVSEYRAEQKRSRKHMARMQEEVDILHKQDRKLSDIINQPRQETDNG